jgi:hypothetical protein
MTCGNSQAQFGGKKMNRLLSFIAVIGLIGWGISLSAQQKPSAADSPSIQNPPRTAPDTSIPQPQTDPTNSHPSARAFEGKIEKSTDGFVLRENVTQSPFKLDDQDKAKKFEGKDVRIMATMDPTTNILHVVDITRVDTE